MLATIKTLLDEIKKLERKVTIKQAKFAKEYAVDGNANRSYKVAYNVKDNATSKSNGSKLLNLPTITNLIEKWKEYNRIDGLGTKEGMIEHLKKAIEEFSKTQLVYDKQGNARLAAVDSLIYKTAVTELNKILGVHSATKTEVDFTGAAMIAEQRTGDFLAYIKQKNRANKTQRE